MAEVNKGIVVTGALLALGVALGVLALQAEEKPPEKDIKGEFINDWAPVIQ